MGLKYIVFTILLTSMTSCLEESALKDTLQEKGRVNNAPYSVDTNYGRYLTDNPIILSNSKNLSSNTDLSQFLNRGQQFITDNTFLIGTCGSNLSNIAECFQIKENPNTPLLSQPQNRWAFPTKPPPLGKFKHLATPEILQTIS